MKQELENILKSVGSSVYNGFVRRMGLPLLITGGFYGAGGLVEHFVGPGIKPYANLGQQIVTALAAHHSFGEFNKDHDMVGVPLQMLAASISVPAVLKAIPEITGSMDVLPPYIDYVGDAVNYALNAWDYRSAFNILGASLPLISHLRKISRRRD